MLLLSREHLGRISQVTTTATTPWSGQQPYLKTGFQQAQQQLDVPSEFYPESTVVPFSQQTEAGLQAQEQRALQGSPLTQAAQAETQRTLGGEYLGAENPYFSAMADRIEREVRPRIDTQFAGAGRSGFGGTNVAHPEMMARTMADALAPLAWKNYAAERGNMQQAAQFAPGLAREDYFDLGQLGQVGAQREGLAGRELSEDIDRWNFSQYEPRDRLSTYMALIKGGVPGGQTTQAQPYFNNPAGNILGGAAAGAGILKDLWGSGGVFS